MKNGLTTKTDILPRNDLALTDAGFSDGGEQFERFFNEVFFKLPKNSRKALLSDWNIYLRFCGKHNVMPTSSSNSIMIKTLSAFVEDEANRVKANTLSRRIASLRTMFSVMNVPNPLVTDKVLKLNIKYTLERISAPSQQAKPLGVEQLSLTLSKLDLNNITELRTAVILSLAYDTMARASELQHVRIEHFNKKSGGKATMLIERSKTDKAAIGSYRYVSKTTMSLIDNWLTKTGIKQGFLIQPISAMGNKVWASSQTDPKPISYNTILRAFKSVGLDKEFSAHSTRVGSTLDQISANIPSHKIQIAGGWKSSLMITYYGRMLEAEESGAAMMAKLNGR